MRFSGFTFLLLGTLFSLSRGTAEVYLLGPGRWSSETASAATLPGRSSRPLHTEKLTVNDVPVQLNAFRLEADREEVCAYLRRNVPGCSGYNGKEPLRLRFHRPDRPEERVLLIPGKNTWTALVMELSVKLPPPRWPQELPPLPAGARATLVTRFTERDAVCGEFSGASGTPGSQLRALASRLRPDGWLPAAAEQRRSIGGNGDIFLRSRPQQEILWAVFHENGNGVFYRKRIH